MKRVRIRVFGIDCASCASHLQQMLLGVDGVESVSVNVPGKNAEILADEKRVSLEAVKAAVVKAGCQMPTEKAVIRITDGNWQEAQKALEELYGIEKVSGQQERLTVLLYPVGIGQQELLSALKKSGCSAVVESWDNGEEELEQEEQLFLLRNLLVSATLSTPIFWSPRPVIQFILATILQFGPGRYFYKGMRRAVQNRQMNMDCLIAVSTSVIYGYSTWLTFTVKDNVKLYFLCQGVLMSLLFFGKYLEVIARGETAKSVRSLVHLIPQKAVRNEKGSWVEVDAWQIQEGDRVRILAGERIPADGILEEGECLVDESMMTGESEPVYHTAGDGLTGGTLNRAGTVQMRVTHVGSDTVLQRMILLVQEAQNSHASVQTLVDRIASFFIPAVFVIAAAVFGVWYFGIRPGDLEHALLTMCGVLVVACPCALGLATPTSIMVGTGSAAADGILFRNAQQLENAAKVTTVVFDKTGTLTEGKTEVERTLPCMGSTKEEVLRIAAALEQFSHHPAAAAVIQAAKSQGVEILNLNPEAVEEKLGYGIRAEIEGEIWACGNRKLMELTGVKGLNKALCEDVRLQGCTELCISKGDRLIGVIGVVDRLRPDAAETVKQLKKEGKEVILLTGDHERTAKAIAEKLGIENVYAEAVPEEKTALIYQ